MKSKKNTLSRILALTIMVVMILVSVGPAFTAASFADEDEEKTSEGDDAKSMDEMKAELSEIDSQKAEAQAEMKKLNSQFEEKKQEVAYLSSQVGEKEEEIQAKQVEIDEQSAKIEQQQKDIEVRYEGLGNRLRTMYKNGSIGFFDVLLGSSNFSELLSNIEMVQKIYESDKETLQELHDVYNELKDALEKLAEKQKELEKARDELQVETDKAIEAQNQLELDAEEIFDHIKVLEEAAAALSGEIAAEQERLDAQIAAMRQEELKKAEEKRKAEEERLKAEAEQKKNELNEKIKELEAKIEEVKAKIAAVKERQGEIDEAQAVVDTLAKELEELGALRDAASQNAEGTEEGSESEEGSEGEGTEEGSETPEYVEGSYEAKEAELNSAKDRVAALKSEIGDLAALQKELEELEAQVKKLKDERDSTTAGKVTTSETPMYTGGSLGWPLKAGKVIWPFGYRGNIGVAGASRYHEGIDIWYSRCGGDPIFAAESGICTNSTRYGHPGYGNVVFIAHGNGITTAYAHMSSMVVSAGTYVEKGQVIGYVGHTGIAAGDHLHFEVWQKQSNGRAKAVDPMAFF